MSLKSFNNKNKEQEEITISIENDTTDTTDTTDTDYIIKDENNINESTDTDVLLSTPLEMNNTPIIDNNSNNNDISLNQGTGIIAESQETIYYTTTAVITDEDNQGATTNPNPELVNSPLEMNNTPIIDNNSNNDDISLNQGTGIIAESQETIYYTTTAVITDEDNQGATTNPNPELVNMPLEMNNTPIIDNSIYNNDISLNQGNENGVIAESSQVTAVTEANTTNNTNNTNTVTTTTDDSLTTSTNNVANNIADMPLLSGVNTEITANANNNTTSTIDSIINTIIGSLNKIAYKVNAGISAAASYVGLSMTNNINLVGSDTSTLINTDSRNIADLLENAKKNENITDITQNNLSNIANTNDLTNVAISDVNKLVQAIASFSPPTMGQTNALTSDYQNSLQPVLTSNLN